MSALPSCTEHHSKLATTLQETRSRHKSLAVVWLDLANDYGNVYHNLTQFNLSHNYGPPQFTAVIESPCPGISARALAQDWSPLVSLQRLEFSKGTLYQWGC